MLDNVNVHSFIRTHTATINPLLYSIGNISDEDIHYSLFLCLNVGQEDILHAMDSSRIASSCCGACTGNKQTE